MLIPIVTFCCVGPMARFAKDKRHNPRAFFADGKALPIDVQLDHGNVSLAGEVLNLSIGGMQFSYNRQYSLYLEEGDMLTLQTIAGPVGLAALVGSTMEVRWVLNNGFFNHIAVGCKFVSLADEQQHLLQQVIDAHLFQL